MSSPRNQDSDHADGAPDAGGASGGDVSRRRFLQTAGSTAVAAGAMPLTAGDARSQPAPLTPTEPTASPAPAGTRNVVLRVNGQSRSLQIEPRVTLLDALRESLALAGTKKGCDRGQCGACTVLVDGRRINSCLTLAVMHEGQEITTIEGIGTPAALHPMQRAFIAADAFQCGYCTPGQVCSAIAAVAELKAGALSAASFDGASGAGRAPSASDDEVRERMSGNLCRCGAYAHIVSAVRSVARQEGVA